MEAAQPCGVEACQHCEARTWDQHLPCTMQTLLLGATSTCGSKCYILMSLSNLATDISRVEEPLFSKLCKLKSYSNIRPNLKNFGGDYNHDTQHKF